MVMSLKIATINIQHGRNLPGLFSFVKKELPDVLCLQEVFEVDADQIIRETGMDGFFHPTVIVKKTYGYPIDSRGTWGVLLLYLPARVQILNQENGKCAYYYYGLANDRIPEFSHPTSQNNVVQATKLLAHDQLYFVANTHFTWSANG